MSFLESRASETYQEMRKKHFLNFLKKVAQPKVKCLVRRVKIIWSVLAPNAAQCRPSDVCEKKKNEEIEKEKKRNKNLIGEIFSTVKQCFGFFK